MTDLTLAKLCDKKINEAVGKAPHEKRRVLAAMLAAVLEAIKKEQ